MSFEKIDIFSISETWLKDYSMCQLKCFYDKNIIVRNRVLFNFLFSFMFLKISVYDDFEKKISNSGQKLDHISDSWTSSRQNQYIVMMSNTFLPKNETCEWKYAHTCSNFWLINMI